VTTVSDETLQTERSEETEEIEEIEGTKQTTRLYVNPACSRCCSAVLERPIFVVGDRAVGARPPERLFELV